jgi:hypothetical protein
MKRVARASVAQRPWILALGLIPHSQAAVSAALVVCCALAQTMQLPSLQRLLLLHFHFRP